MPDPLRGCAAQSDEHRSLRLNDDAAARPANRSDASSLVVGPGGVEGAVSGGVSEEPVVGKFNHSGRGHRNPAVLTRILQTGHKMLNVPWVML